MNNSEKHQEVNAAMVKQMPGWENMSDEFAENMAATIKKLAAIFYITIAREMNLKSMDEANDFSQDENSKSKRIKKKEKIEV